MRPICLVRLKPSVDATENDDLIQLTADGRGLSVPREAGTELIRMLRDGGLPAPGFAAFTAAAARGHVGLRAATVLRSCAREGWLEYVVRVEDTPVVTATQTAPPRTLPRVPEPGEGRYVLSRFAYCHAVDGRTMLRSPRSFFTVAVHDPRVGHLAAALALPRSVVELSAATGMAPELVAVVVALLAHAGIVGVVGADGRRDEDDEPGLRLWEFHDLLFHARAREGVHGGPSGGTYRFRDLLAPLPVVKPAGDGELLDLPVPRRVRRPELLLDDVLDARASYRRHGERPITLDEIGEFLYRSARLVEIDRTGGEEVARRPFAGGGALHELELYLIVTRCAGLAPGVYHYRAAEHAVERVAPPSAHSDALVQDACYSTATETAPQILIVVASRFGRLAWKYESIAYSLTLKHVGCLIQNLYLVATSMGLAPCAVGCGNSEAFARATGISPYLEAAVGEFIIGTRPEDTNTHGR